MEFASRLRWILVSLVGVLAIVLIAWGLVSIARGVFAPRDDSAATTAESETDEPAYNVSTAGKARLIIDGPVVANEDQRSAVIEITPSAVNMTVYKSYGQIEVAKKSYVNTTASYRAFMSALENLDVTSRIEGTDSDTDTAEEGVCASGRRYIFELDDDLRRWSTSCSRKEGTAGFKMSEVRTLFQKQVPEYRELLRGTGL